MKVVPLPVNETTLIKKAKQQQAVAQQQLFDRYAPKMLSVCRYYIKDIQQAEATMLDGFFKAFSNIKGSRFIEIGTAWKTRVLNNSNFVRIKYGASIQINGLIPIDNQYFVQDGDKTYLKPFQYDSKKIKLSVYNLVFPVHIELGPSKRIEKKEHIRYSTRNKFKIGIGGYAGFNIGTRQKLKYTQDGSRKKDKIKQSYNVSELVYGWSSYVAFDRLALYMKYDLSPLFKSPNKEQHNVSLGLRFDVD